MSESTESNWDRCLRLAHEIPKNQLITQLLEYIKEDQRRKRIKRPLWAIVSDATANGSGVSQAIVEIYYPKGLYDL